VRASLSRIDHTEKIKLPESRNMYLMHTNLLYSVGGLERSELVDLMAAQGAFGTDFYDRSTKTIVGTMLWTEYRPVIKIGPKGAVGSHEIRPIHSVPSLG